ncbi:glycosidase [Paenibacillus antri]|uniref:Glycosidase n=1 Tax=Paenibacillus antri TaxID=2582848 RepID=A0A5R9FYS8_9BACL|nr:glycoside hydrolase family 43 protein [Paenibacillus antri]TLS48651.1 glycosidase [Paenibacillus antri]
MLHQAYKNPLNIQQIGDPFVLKASDGRYYCYPTSAVQDGFKAWSSDDLIEWKAEGFVYEKAKNEKAWGYRQFWAPEVVERDGKFYMYYTARWKEKDSLRIGIAVADAPTGPFRDVSDRPMFDDGIAAIDAHVFTDEDGRRYLYYSRDCSENVVDGRKESHIYAFELGSDMMTPKHEGVLLIRPDQPWEFKSGEDVRWNEGPFVLKHAGAYYLMYSANCFAARDYSDGYAVSDSPLGPYKKFSKNPILAADGTKVSGPGHHCVTVSPDGSELFIVYHTHTDPEAGGGDRQVCMDRMIFAEDGSVVVFGPTLSKQPAPSRNRGD